MTQSKYSCTKREEQRHRNWDWNPEGQTVNTIAPCRAPGAHGVVCIPKGLESTAPVCSCRFQAALGLVLLGACILGRLSMLLASVTWYLQHRQLYPQSFTIILPREAYRHLCYAVHHLASQVFLENLRESLNDPITLFHSFILRRTKVHVASVSLKVAVQLAFHSSSFCLCIPSDGITHGCHYVGLTLQLSCVLASPAMPRSADSQSSRQPPLDNSCSGL